jgi:RNA-directed DNA polymerase
MTKAFTIPKQQVVDAYKLVKANAGSAGIDQQSLSDFEINLKDNLYKIWNRLSSGCYFPPPVMAVEIPKKSGGKRLLGIPTVSDRIAQMVVKLSFEPKVEPHFLNDSYGYRPNKSALDAVGITRERCWKYDWVLEFDIKGLFDNISHDLLMKAVRKHTQEKWLIMYIERWLTAPMVMPDGSTVERKKGTPQGGVISPVLSNLFLHYVLDKWLQINYPRIPWCRYADDGLLHCETRAEAFAMLEKVAERFMECGLEMHPDKTKIIYCKDSKRKGNYEITRFDFLGYTFTRRMVRTHSGALFLGFTPVVSKNAIKAMRDKVRKWKIPYKTSVSLEDIAIMCNPTLRGWLNYYGKYSPSYLEPVWNQFNMKLTKWAQHKYKKIDGKKTKAALMIQSIIQKKPTLFHHWKLGTGTGFV